MNLIEQISSKRRTLADKRKPGICIECALRYHEFSQKAGISPWGDNFTQSLLSEALIDAQYHVLWPSVRPTQIMICSECRKKVGALYIPYPVSDVCR